jgi:hypothetical protein
LAHILTAETAPRLLATHEAVQPRELRLIDDRYELGRAPGCQIVVVNAQILRVHAKSERDGPRFVLSDAGSVNGTFVNQRRLVGPHLLADDELIGLGGATPHLRFLDSDPTLPAQVLLHFDEATLQFFVGVRPVALTPAQLRLLRHLYLRAGAVYSRNV